jgi:hypothetical protein
MIKLLLPQVLGQGDHGIQASTRQPRRHRTVQALRDTGRCNGAHLSKNRLLMKLLQHVIIFVYF